MVCEVTAEARWGQFCGGREGAPDSLDKDRRGLCVASSIPPALQPEGSRLQVTKRLLDLDSKS